MQRVDYSDLVEALRDGDEETANQLLKEVMPRLEDYLRVVMNASPIEAKECAHQAFLDVFERIRDDKINESKYIFSYLITTSRHTFLHYKKSQHRFTSDDEQYNHHVEPADQMQSLIDEERMQILEQCLEELDPDDRDLMNYLLAHPDATTQQVSKKFGISGANVRTKKSRLTHRLHHSVKRKMSN
ncbi:sigma-70 family RNA polymerase sigma factor [Rhodohalobacter sp. SW132]|uniref:RNA polymerase sigma factor n=1 Tax=Rhodohalobacter sp. SW132 TaxID=2293433 RepID=UPI000E266637|nr:sigma-70 family RNA polymerase sigma factor [Rhodohalobacter sp. SW132]REL25077.1 sigma-70 family RNA polymerase sigma factor [Rhodohalobacter sp. SW132]